MTFQCGLQNVFKNFLNFFCPQMLKKPPSKVAQNNSNPLFFPYCPNGPHIRVHAPKCDL